MKTPSVSSTLPSTLPPAPLLSRLFTQRDAHHFVWRLLLPCLLPADAVRLVVAALETTHGNGNGLAAFAFAEWLLHGDAPFIAISKLACLHEAAQSGCWYALERLALRLPSSVRAAPRSVKPVAFPDELIKRALRAVKRTGQHVTIAALEAAIARSDHHAVRVLIALKDASLAAPEHRAKRIQVRNRALRAAADARQLALVDWLASTADHVALVLPYDETSLLQAVGWSCVDPAFPHCTTYYCATAKYGFQEWQGWDDNMFPHCPHALPLGDHFAGDGGWDILQALDALDALVRQRSHLPRLFSPRAMVNAASNGHFDIVKWLYDRYPEDLNENVLEAAAEHAQLDLLQWAMEQHLPRDAFQNCGTGAARGGHVVVLHWLKRVDRLIWDDFGAAPALKLAIKGGSLPVVQFLIVETGTSLLPSLRGSLPLCRSVAIAKYLLQPLPPLVHHPSVVTYLVFAGVYSARLEMVQYYVLERGLWSPLAFLYALDQLEPSVPVCAFLYAHAHARATGTGTALTAHVSFKETFTVSRCLFEGKFETAQWLARAVPEVTMGAFAVSSETKFKSVKELAREPRAHDAVLACVRHRRDECRSVAWLPEWAIRTHSIEAFTTLVKMQHPTLIDTDEGLHSVVRYCRDSRFMLYLLNARPSKCGSLAACVFQWAAGIGTVAVLDAVYAQVPAKQLDQCISDATKVALPRGYTDVLEWCVTRTDVGRARRACRHGQVTVLEWLYTCGHLPTKPAFVEEMVRDAVRHGHLSCLQWLLETVVISDSIIAAIKRECVRLRRVDAVRLLTRYTSSR